MKITLQQSNQLKSIAILMMLCLHLFNRDYINLFQPLFFIGKQPLSYYISLFCDACVPIFAFVSGYGLYHNYQQSQLTYFKGNMERLKKLYINYWIIIGIFAVGLGLLLNKEEYPGDMVKLLGNITGLHPTYNGAWWFFTTYVFFILTSQFWFSLITRLNPYIYIIALGFIYLMAFYFRVYQSHIFQSEILHWLHTQLTLYFCTLFQFILGAFALAFNWYSKIQVVFSRIKQKSLVALLGIMLLIVIHGLIPNFIIAPFTGLGFIFLYLQIYQGRIINNILNFLSLHATNLWLVHMFFYITFFKEWVYSFQYVPLIFIVLLVLCIISSYLINFLNNLIAKWV